MLEVNNVSDFTVVVIKNDVPKVVEVAEETREVIQKAYYDQETEDSFEETTTTKLS